MKGQALCFTPVAAIELVHFFDLESMFVRCHEGCLEKPVRAPVILSVFGVGEKAEQQVKPETVTDFRGHRMIWSRCRHTSGQI
ncbi:MAG TPA: hypothetical protein VK198_11755 [Terriglobales bacterium]|nr:hypothetical protein [Terriglobales bacterium]